jgi:hypothetical protein
MNIIEELKTNERPFGLMSEEMRRTAIAISPVGNFEFLTNYRPNGGPEWALLAKEQDKFRFDTTYRLRPEYKEEPEIVEFKVYPDGGLLMWGEKPHDTRISEAVDDTDFIGFKYEGIKNLLPDIRRYKDKNGRLWGYCADGYEVLTPTHVVFRKTK